MTHAQEDILTQVQQRYPLVRTLVKHGDLYVSCERVEFSGTRIKRSFVVEPSGNICHDTGDIQRRRD